MQPYLEAPMLALMLTLACTPSWKKMSGEELLTGITHDDGDGIDGAADLCPQAREDFDGFQDEDGCPDLDNDMDGFPDRRDACPDEKGGEPWIVDSLDGCKPWSDVDGDGIHDDDDACPDKPERVNGIMDEDGCPDFKVVVTKERIEFYQKVMFATGTADLAPESLDLLQAIATTLIDNPPRPAGRGRRTHRRRRLQLLKPEAQPGPGRFGQGPAGGLWRRAGALDLQGLRREQAGHQGHHRGGARRQSPGRAGGEEADGGGPSRARWAHEEGREVAHREPLL